jgi:hypothetical protein
VEAREERRRAAAALLQEAVYRSRETQAAAGGLAMPGGNCGLGHKAAVNLELSTRGEELFRLLWPMQPEDQAMLRIQAVLADWVRRQDALDRKRNHFLKDFRHAHGFDRTRYTAEQRAEFESGIEHINAEENERRELAAQELLSAGG